MFNKDTFCSMPWSSITVEPTGNFKTCMFTQPGAVVDANGATQNILTHDISEGLNSPLHKEIRLAQANNQRHPLCTMCWHKEDAEKAVNHPQGISTRYHRTFEQFAHIPGAATLDNASLMMLPDGSIPNAQAIALDLRFTNVCNMKCIMCNPIYSNQWYDDYVKLTGKTEFGFKDNEYKIKLIEKDGVYKDDSLVPWHDSEVWWEKFDKIKHQLHHIYITGGEPFLVKGHERLLDTLIDSGRANDITLNYDTNLSVINSRLLDKLKKFKKVDLSLSCDDTEQRYELIRFPGNFNKFVSNLEYLQQENFAVKNISTCVGMYSLFAPIRLNEFFVANSKYHQNGNSIPLMVRFLQYPIHANIAYLPKAVKLKVINQYQKSTLDDYWKKHIIGYLHSNMGMSEENCIEKTQQHMRFLDKMDEIRGTNWQATFPEVIDLLKDYK